MKFRNIYLNEPLSSLWSAKSPTLVVLLKLFEHLTLGTLSDLGQHEVGQREVGQQDVGQQYMGQQRRRATGHWAKGRWVTKMMKKNESIVRQWLNRIYL